MTLPLWPCPKCGARTVVVEGTRQGVAVMRLHRCRDCNGTFGTLEMPLSATFAQAIEAGVEYQKRPHRTPRRRRRRANGPTG
jgi:hypothetical protein